MLPNGESYSVAALVLLLAGMYMMLWAAFVVMVLFHDLTGLPRHPNSTGASIISIHVVFVLAAGMIIGERRT